MNQILESVFIALGAIWANKLRSFMTVLGNIVAVTSIVTVVTLIQGMNAMVSTAIISDVGADSFTIQRQPPIRNEEDEERTRNNPILTMDEADAIRAFSPLVTSVMGQTGRGGTVSYRDTELSQVTVQAVTERIRQLLQLQRRARPADEPDRSGPRRRRWPSSAGTRQTGCSGRTIRSKK